MTITILDVLGEMLLVSSWMFMKTSHCTVLKSMLRQVHSRLSDIPGSIRLDLCSFSWAFHYSYGLHVQIFKLWYLSKWFDFHLQVGMVFWILKPVFGFSVSEFETFLDCMYYGFHTLVLVMEWIFLLLTQPEILAIFSVLVINLNYVCPNLWLVWAVLSKE